eukprot:7885207-Alexandrium_andersonii.AAC.1
MPAGDVGKLTRWPGAPPRPSLACQTRGWSRTAAACDGLLLLLWPAPSPPPLLLLLLLPSAEEGRANVPKPKEHVTNVKAE